MKRKMILSLAAILASTAVLAHADNITFVGVPTGVNDGQYYVMPYEISIDGTNQLVTCYDVYDDVNFGDTWQANLLTLNQAAVSGFFSATTDALAKYEEVAWLDAQTYTNTTQQIGLQYAIWNVFGTAPNTTSSLQYESAANTAAASGYEGFDFSGVRFVEQIGGVVGKNGTKQAFVDWGSSAPSPQSGSAGAVPEPGSAMLFMAGMIVAGSAAAFGPSLLKLRASRVAPPQ